MGDHGRRTSAARPQVVVMEGPLKKRGATMPVMRDRYCVATWEAPVSPTERGRKAVILRTYKNREAYTDHPHKPAEEYQVKCVGQWDGKGNFHKYPHPFLLETMESKVLMCAAPTREDKDKWTSIMDDVSMTEGHSTDDGGSNTGSEQHPTRVADKHVLFGSEKDDGGDEDEDFGKAAAAAVTNARRMEKQVIADAENDLLSDGEGIEGEDSNSDLDRPSRVKPVSPLALSPVNDQVLFKPERSESFTPSDDEHPNDNEPADWGLYGDEHGDGPSRYDVVDGPTLSLDSELLSGAPKNAAPLASDAFLFEQNGPTFGAVVVPKSSGGDGTDDFVDPVMQERLERKEKEKQAKRVAKKLESNRDLYAEMAAARLKSMRKDAKTKPRSAVTHRRRGEEDEEEDYHGDDWSDHGYAEDERSRAVSNTESSRTVSPKAAPVEPFELEEIQSEDEPSISRQSSKKKKKEAESTDNMLGEDLLFGEASVVASTTTDEASVVVASATTEEASGVVADEETTPDVDEEEVRRLRKEKRRLRRQQQEEEAARQQLEAERARARTASSVSGSLPEEPVRRSSMDDQWQRATETQKRKDERRRARKEKARREAEAAAAAEELARQHREEMRRLEEEELKHERLERRERKKSKEKNALDKKAKELKQKEAELLAEAEKLKQIQEMMKADEIKDVPRKTKRRDKYTSPAERIHRRDKELEAALMEAPEESTALVVVEEPPQPAPTTPATPAAPAKMMSIATETELPDAVAVEEVVTPSVNIEVPVVAPPASAPVSTSPTKHAEAPQASQTVVPPAPQSAPVAPSGLFPTGYTVPTAPFSTPMPFAAAPFSAVHLTPGFAGMPYSGGVAMPGVAMPGVAMPTPYYPHLGYVGGIAPMNHAQMQAFAMMHPAAATTISTSTTEEEPFIGPKLPSPSSTSAKNTPGPAPAPTSSSSTSLPDLPDVATF